MSSIIEVQNLSKSYTISHEGKERYTALRDIMTQKAKKIFSFPQFLFSNSNKEITKEEFWALKDVNFNIEKGDRVGIIGRNGAGKSTLLKILSRITDPTHGKIKIKGRVASLLEVGTGFHPELTGRENIFLNGAILGMSRLEIKKHFDAIVDFAEIERFLDTPVKRYSSGMYVRLAFAVAAHLEPEILVVDEVLAVGDAQFQKKCLGKMEDVSKNEGRTVLFVSHNTNALSTLCKDGIFLQEGHLITISGITECIETYLGSNDLSNYSKIYNSKKDGLITSIELNENAINLGDDLIINFNFSDNSEKRNFITAIHIDNNKEELIAHIVNMDDDFEVNSSYQKVSITIKSLNMIPGNYSLTFWFGEDYVNVIEEHKKCLFFTVINNGTFTKRTLEYPQHSKMVFQSKWEGLKFNKPPLL